MTDTPPSSDSLRSLVRDWYYFPPKLPDVLATKSAPPSPSQPSGPTIEEKIAAVQSAERFLKELWQEDGPMRQQLRAALSTLLAHETQTLELAEAREKISYFMAEYQDEQGLSGAREERDFARAELADLQRTFDLQWKADQRAIKQWQEVHPGNDMVWPDRCNMVVWMLDQLAEARVEIEWRKAQLPAESWLWAFDTANAIERDIRALADHLGQPPHAVPPENPTDEMLASAVQTAAATGAIISEVQAHDIWQAMYDEWLSSVEKPDDR